MDHALALTTTAFLLSIEVILAQEPVSDTVFETKGENRAIPTWEVPATAFKMGLVSTAILSVADPEAALVRASILTPRLHGNVGEALVNSQLRATGGWKPIRPRNGPQGIDHVWIKYDKAGRPIDMVVGETKFGTGRLGITKSGRQMSETWIKDPKRLAGLADDWDAMAKDVAARHGASKARHFRLTADFLRAAAEGRISYRSELYRVKIEGDVAKISVRRLGPDGFAIGPERLLPPVKIAGRPANIIKAQLEGEIQEVYPALKGDSAGRAEARRLAEQVYSHAKTAQSAISRRSPVLRLAGTTSAVLAAGGLVAGGTDAVVQLWAGGSVDWNRTATMAGLGAASAGSAETAQLVASQALLRNAALRSRSIALGRSMRLLPSRAVSLLPKATGGLVGALAFSYGGYALGLYDAKEANRTAIAGTAGAAAGMAAYSATTAGIMAYAASVGTASTGTAISSLSGAAATNASLAWLGGGALGSAEGASGMAGGASLLGVAGAAVAAVAVIAVASAVMYGFHLHDTAQDWKRVGNTIEVLRNHTGDFPGNPWARPAQAL